MDPRAVAERWLEIAVKLLSSHDFLGSKTFAIRAREADPNNVIAEQILAIVDTLLASEKRVNNQYDWYAILQLAHLIRDTELISSQYRRLVILLNPERNGLPFADHAVRLVFDAWSVLSDPTKKWFYDSELSLYLQRLESQQQQQPPPQPLTRVDPVRGGSPAQLSTYQFFQAAPQAQTQPHSQPQPQQPLQWEQPQMQESQSQQPLQPLQRQRTQWQQRSTLPAPPQQQPPQQQQRLQPQPQLQLLQQRQAQQQKSQPQPQQQPKPVQTQQHQPQPRSQSKQSRPQPQPQSQPNQSLPQPQTQSQPKLSQSQAQCLPEQSQRQPQCLPEQSRPQLQLQPQQQPTQQQPERRTENSRGLENAVRPNEAHDVDINRSGDPQIEESGVDINRTAAHNEEPDTPRFWTACPYCYYIYEYPQIYLEYTLRCQNCRRPFHAAEIPSPPPVSNGKNDDGKESSFCCWGFFPLGFSMTEWKKNNNLGAPDGSNWVPFSPMFTCPVNENANPVPNDYPVAASGRRPGIKGWVYRDDDDEDFDELPESSDDSDSSGDWNRGSYKRKKRKKKKKVPNSVSTSGKKRGRPPKNPLHRNENVINQKSVPETEVANGETLQGESNMQNGVPQASNSRVVDGIKKAGSSNANKHTGRGVKDRKKLDLNVEFSNDVEDHAPTARAGNGAEEGIEGIAFFEGLDEFLSTLPILNVVGDDKAKPS